MDDLEEGIGLRAYGQKDPVKEYQFEADNMFAEMNDAIKEETVKMLLQVVPATTVRRAEAPKVTGESRKSDAPVAAPTQRQNVYGRAATPEKASSTPYVKPASEKVGRNDPCPCGSGKKYKKCCGANAPDEE